MRDFTSQNGGFRHRREFHLTQAELDDEAKSEEAAEPETRRGRGVRHGGRFWLGVLAVVVVVIHRFVTRRPSRGGAAACVGAITPTRRLPMLTVSGVSLSRAAVSYSSHTGTDTHPAAQGRSSVIVCSSRGCANASSSTSTQRSISVGIR